MNEPTSQIDLPDRIYLLGFMGSGKSTLGRLVSSRIGYSFVDLDAAIERHHRKSVAELFNELGDLGFRQAESSELRRVSRLEHAVVACGGGVVTIQENRDIIRETGLSVYLRLPAGILYERLSRSNRRPLLFDARGQTLSGEALRSRIDQILSSRTAHYEQADVIVDLEEEVPAGDAAQDVLRHIYEYSKSSI
jgi:shikimate kinase